VITIEKFNLPPRVQNIFKLNNWTTPESLIFNLERYKFLSRQEILSTLNKALSGTEDLIHSVDKVNSVSIRQEHKPIIEEIESLHSVKVNVTDSDSAEIIANMFSHPNMADIKLKLPYSDIKVKKVTPLNFYEITETPLEEWNSKCLIDRIILDCIEKGGTDIHISADTLEDGTPDFFIKYRIKGKLYRSDLFKIDQAMNTLLVKNFIQKQTKAYSGDIDSIYGIVTIVRDVFGDGEVTFRISANKAIHGYTLVGRVTTKSTSSLRISELGFPEEVQRYLYRLTTKRSGLTLITGARGTGKSTTALALSREIAAANLSVVDYSSPVEVLMPFPQVDYGDDTKRLVELVRLSKKQDVDVVFANEIPDMDTAAAIGDLINSSTHVITTFHIDRAWHLPYKLEELYPGMLKSVITRVNACINQKMFSIQCPHCRAVGSVYGLDALYKDFLLDKGVTQYQEAKGCDICRDSKPRLQPFVEIIYFDDKLLTKLLECSESYEMEQVLRRKLEETKSSFEYILADAVKRGDIRFQDLDTIL
jgi:Tfp pilus assembly pilus retraction ATPase PilT